MIVLRGLHNLFIYLLTVVSFFVGTAITLCFVPFAKKKTYPFQIAARLWARFMLFFSGIKVVVNGLDNIPFDRSAILVSNHQGAADIPVLLASIPVNFNFAIKKELFKIPVFGWYIRRAGYFSIDREAVLSAYKTLEKIVEILKSGESVMIFPEGTRTRDGSLGKFKRGSLMAALKSGAPIVPIAISGSFEILPRGEKLFRPAKVRLTVGKPIYIKTEEEYDEKVEAVREAIAKLL